MSQHFHNYLSPKFCVYKNDKNASASPKSPAGTLSSEISSIKKLSCCREAARCFVSLNILLSHSRSLTQGHSKWQPWEGHVQVTSLVFHCN